MTVTNHEPIDKQEIIHLTAKDLMTAPTKANDILTRARLPKKKRNPQTSRKANKKDTLTTTTTNDQDQDQTQGNQTQSIDDQNQEQLMNDDDLIDQLLSQTNQVRLSSEQKSGDQPNQEHQSDQNQNHKQKQQPRRSSNSISKKLHDLGEDLKEVAHAVVNSTKSSSSSPVNHLINPKRKVNRQKEKIAKRQAAQLQAQLDAQLELSNNPVVDHRQLEADAILKICNSLKLKMIEIIPDGHCLFSAIADQLNYKGIKLPRDDDDDNEVGVGSGGIENEGKLFNHQICRRLASDYMREHPDQFIHYLPAQDEGLEDGLMSSIDYHKHCDQIRDSARWGGEPEILALSKSLKYSIHIIQAFQPIIKISDEEFFEFRGGDALLISYHRKSYGLGEHYNSLRPIL